MDKHVQPSGDPCLGSKISEYYGNLNPVDTIANIVGPFQTGVHACSCQFSTPFHSLSPVTRIPGDLHAAVYDFGNNIMYVGMAGAPILANGTAVLGGKAPPLHYSLMYSLIFMHRYTTHRSRCAGILATVVQA